MSNKSYKKSTKKSSDNIISYSISTISNDPINLNEAVVNATSSPYSRVFNCNSKINEETSKTNSSPNSLFRLFRNPHKYKSSKPISIDIIENKKQVFLDMGFKSNDEAFDNVIEKRLPPPPPPPRNLLTNLPLTNEKHTTDSNSNNFRRTKSIDLWISAESESTIELKKMEEFKFIGSKKELMLNEKEVGGDDSIFLNASIQYLQRQFQLRQEVRGLWHGIQQMYHQQEILPSAFTKLHQELQHFLSLFNIEKQEKVASTHQIKTGLLKLLRIFGQESSSSTHSSSSSKATTTAKYPSTIFHRKFTSNSPTSSLSSISVDRCIPKFCWCVLNYDEGTLKVQETVQNIASNYSINKKNSTSPSLPPSSSSSSLNMKNKQRLSSWIVNDSEFNSIHPMSSTISSNLLVGDIIDLFECECSVIDAKYGQNRFQLHLVNGDDLVFECEDENSQKEWIQSLQQICCLPIINLNHQLSIALNSTSYLNSLLPMLPLTVPLGWLRRKIQQKEKKSGIARRNSKNLSMIQIAKDLERDRMIFDGEIVQGNNDVEEGMGGISKAFKLLVTQIVQYLLKQHYSNQPSSCLSSPLPPLSPSSRMFHSLESKALAFAERILRGSSRTQTGGDIYDAIQTVLSNSNLTICPVSADASPVRLHVLQALHEQQEASFIVQVKAEMVFQLIPLNLDDLLWQRKHDQHQTSNSLSIGCIKGSFERTFELGKKTTRGQVIIELIT